MATFVLVLVGSASEDRKSSVKAGLLEQAAPFFLSSDVDGPHPHFILCLDEAETAVLKPVHQNYHCRFIWTERSTLAELVDVVQPLRAAMEAARVEGRVTGRFTSTRGAAESINFLSAVRQGLASDGGLYMLKAIPAMPASQWSYLFKTRSVSYVEAAEMILEQLVDTSLTPAVLYPLLLEAYDRSRWSNLENICPLTPLLGCPAEGKAGDPPQGWMKDMSVLELYHGPTAAFKDFALQLFPRYFSVATAQAAALEAAATATATPSLPRPKYVILAATSGDTGVAAISGFVNAGGQSQVMVLYPLHGVSPVQQMQMLSYDDGAAVRAYGIPTNFDFCQQTVKTIFADEELRKTLATPSSQPAKSPVYLSSANSINWGRLIPQVVYYAWAYRQLVQHPPAGWRCGDAVDVVVPCGNFGNILSGYVAKQMGVPIRRLIVASNANDVLHEFITTGVYDIRHRSLAVTASPSIDILKASNVERFLLLLSGGDAALVSTLMAQLDTDGVFRMPAEMTAKMQLAFWAGRCSEAECAAMIQEIYTASEHRRLLDPHTAVAVQVARQYREAVRQPGEEAPPVPLIVTSTAHWAKFPSPVLGSISGHGATLGAAAATVQQGIAEVRRLYEAVLKTGAPPVHPSLLRALDAAEQAALSPRTAAADLAAIEAELVAFAGQ